MPDQFTRQTVFGWGLSADVPVPADCDGDGKIDVAIHRPSTGDWWILWSSTNYLTYSTYGWGLGGDLPFLSGREAFQCRLNKAGEQVGSIKRARRLTLNCHDTAAGKPLECDVPSRACRTPTLPRGRPCTD